MMARTPLFGMLQRTLSKAWWTTRQGQRTSARIDDDWMAWNMKRRQFLHRSLGTAALASIPWLGGGCHTDDDDRAMDPNIAIIGAGLAGLHCALRLHQAGVGVRLYDAGDRVGGRVLSGRALFAPDQVVELGAEFIDSNHVCMRALAEEFGLQLDDTMAPNELEGMQQNTYFFKGRFVSEAEIVALFEPLAAIITATLDAVEMDDALFDAIDHASLTEFLEVNGADPLLQSILEIAYLNEYGLEGDAQTAFNLLCTIDAETLDPFRMYGDSDERFRIHDGNDTLPAAMAEVLADQIFLETRLVSISELSDGRFRLTFLRRGGSTFDTLAQQVVFALPFTTLRQVDLDLNLPEDKRRAIQELGYGTNTKLMGGVTSRVWREQFQASGSAFTDNGIQVVFDGTEQQPGRAGVISNYTGGNRGIDIGHGTAEAQMLAALPMIDQIFPGVAAAFIPGSAVRLHWTSMPLFQGSYTCFRPGQTSFSDIIGRREGNLHFCGEHTSIDFQGFMEGAVASGARVATTILSDLGRPLPAALQRMNVLHRAVSQRTVPLGRRRMLRRRRPGFVR